MLRLSASARAVRSRPTDAKADELGGGGGGYFQTAARRLRATLCDHFVNKRVVFFKLEKPFAAAIKESTSTSSQTSPSSSATSSSTSAACAAARPPNSSCHSAIVCSAPLIVSDAAPSRAPGGGGGYTVSAHRRARCGGRVGCAGRSKLGLRGRCRRCGCRSARAARVRGEIGGRACSVNARYLLNASSVVTGRLCVCQFFSARFDALGGQKLAAGGRGVTKGDLDGVADGRGC
jgi:hypothetical protein